MLSKLEQLKQKVKRQVSGQYGDLNTSIYYLIKELKCLPEIIGREYEIIYEKSVWWKPPTWRKVKMVIQKPMRISTLISLFKELEQDYKRQEKETKKIKSKRK
jgi:hypothetical protein